jgi:hypothetical protein
MTTDTEEEKPMVKPTTDEEMGPIKSRKVDSTKVWVHFSRVTLIVYLCASTLAYIMFSRGQIEGCFGLCDSMNTKAQPSRNSSSESASKDSPQSVSQQRLLPSFAKGGVIFFLHIPKTVRKPPEDRYFWSVV